MITENASEGHLTINFTIVLSELSRH